MKVVALVQARMGSTRLPNKVMKKINDVPLIELLLKRLSLAGNVDQIVLATSTKPENKPLVEHVKNMGYQVYEGSEDDVLDRYYQAAKAVSADIVIRITGDCPLIDPDLVDEMVTTFKNESVDYLSNGLPELSYPDGLDVEILTMDALMRNWEQAEQPHEREHVTPFVRESNQFKVAGYQHSEDLSALRWTVDEPADFEVIKHVFDYFHPVVNFSWQQVLELQNQKPELFALNTGFIRNEGATMGKGQKLWKRAKQVIPGGNMLLSKRAEMFLPEKWPAYFSKAKGCKVWDLDGKEYIDMSIMGIGTNTLGYGHEEVDAAVQKVVLDGNMSSFNCPEEVYLAEKLVELHPWADMARLARTGGEANAIAVRIARAASGKDKIAICGYHGWHDWYLSANLADDQQLDGHLLPGLEPKGVPRNLKDTIYPFTYNNFEELEALVRKHDIGVIKMEVRRNDQPKDNFLQKVRQLADKNNIVLIFDECTSGFRESNGGLHKVYDVEPDIAVFGKTLGNGYAITAIIGRRDMMDCAQSTFISSTFWTERIGPVAALKTLEVMEREKSWDYITSIGADITQKWIDLAQKYALSITTGGLSSLTNFSFNSPNALAYKTLITQEMLEKGYLAGNCVYTCTAHTSDIIDTFFTELDPVFALIKECEQGRDVNTLLKSPICHGGFKRLN